jgi:hypothetical protein
VDTDKTIQEVDGREDVSETEAELRRGGGGLVEETAVEAEVGEAELAPIDEAATES